MSVTSKLIVAIDTIPDQAIAMAEKISGTGLYWVKLETTLRLYGYKFVKEMHVRGFNVMADLKLFGIPSTLTSDAKMLSKYRPGIVTVVTCSGLESLRAFREALPRWQILGVTVLTSMSRDSVKGLYRTTSRVKAREGALMSREAGLDGVVCAGENVEAIRLECGPDFKIVVTGARSPGVTIANDDQVSTVTPVEAFRLGADMVVVGRQITEAEDVKQAVSSLIAEVETLQLASV